MQIQDTKNILCSFKGLILDADGVLFSGHESRAELPDGNVVIIKTRHLHDAQGLSFLRALGIKVVFATGEDEPLPSIVKKINNLPSVISGKWEPVSILTNKKTDKVKSLEVWQKENGLTWEDCVYIGDDRTDFEAMSLVMLSVCPLNAQRLIKKISNIQLKACGGEGAIREFAEMVLDARGIDEITLLAA